VLQKMGREIKGLTRTPTYAKILNRFDTNLTCPRMSPLLTPSICLFLIMFIVLYSLIVPRAVLKLKKPSPGLSGAVIGLFLTVKSVGFYNSASRRVNSSPDFQVRSTL
jgi:hypothetical protein